MPGQTLAIRVIALFAAVFVFLHAPPSGAITVDSEVAFTSVNQNP